MVRRLRRAGAQLTARTLRTAGALGLAEGQFLEAPVAS